MGERQLKTRQVKIDGEKKSKKRTDVHNDQKVLKRSYRQFIWIIINTVALLHNIPYVYKYNMKKNMT